MFKKERKKERKVRRPQKNESQGRAHFHRPMPTQEEEDIEASCCCCLWGLSLRVLKSQQE